MVKPKKKGWVPRYCPNCQEVIKPNEKKVVYESIKKKMHQFHDKCFTELLGKTVGGRASDRKAELLVNKIDRQRERRDFENQWNLESGTPPRRRNAPKVHVTKFEPKPDTKAIHLKLLIDTIRQQKRPLTSEELAKFTNIKRSTITFRLWENTKGYPQAKDNIFYIAERGSRGVQYYDLIENLKVEK